MKRHESQLAMLALCALCSLGAIAGCHRPDDEDLGIAKSGAHTVALDHLTDPDALLAALFQPGSVLDARLGPRAFNLSRTMTLSGGHGEDRIDDSVHFDADGKGSFHLTHDLDHPLALAPGPSKETDAPRDKIDPRAQGMEAVALPGRLFVRARYGRFIERHAEPGELDRLRELGEQLVADDLALVLPVLEVSDAGETKLPGRRCHKLILKKGAPRAMPKSDDPGKAWRQHVDVNELSGELAVDVETGALLSARVDTKYTIQREGGPLRVSSSIRQDARSMDPITPPIDAILGPRRSRPMVDRAQLLDGLLPAPRP